MSAISTLGARNNFRIIEQKYIERVLREESTNIMEAQDRLISRHRLTRKIPEITRRRFTVSANRAEFVHPLRQRFIDMRRSRGIKGRSIPIHNKIIYGHFNDVIGRIAYGFTQDIVNEIANEYQIQL